MRVLVDTSVWSGALRRTKQKRKSKAAQELQNLVLEHRADLIGPFRQELLSGLKVDAQFEKLEKYLEAFPDIPLPGEDYVTAARYFNACRAKGVQGSNTDFLICAVAVRCNLAILTTDRDFARLAKHLPILLHECRGSKPRHESRS